MNAAGPTRREGDGAGPTRREGDRVGPTRREGSGAGPTRREGDAGGPPQVRRVRRTLLPPELTDDYEPLYDLPSVGAQADIVVCRRIVDDVEVAVKIYRISAGQLDTGALERLRDTHADHVVPISRHSYTSDPPWEIQEYFPLGSLAEWMRAQDTRPSAAVATEMIRELSAALRHIHDRDVIHRDLKPENVLVRSSHPLDLVLADFGLASELALSLDIRSLAGTYAYLPPESHGGNFVSTAGDWWALGVVLHQVLVGHTPFVDEQGEPLLDSQIRSVLYDGAYEMAQTGDKRFDLLLSGLLTHDRRGRWGADEVASWLEGESPEVHRDRPRRPETRALQPFVFGDEQCADPAALAAATKTHWRRAGELLAGRRVEELRAWLARTEASQGAEQVLGARLSPEPALVRLQVVMDPSSPPAFRGRSLDNAGLMEVLSSARTGDAEAIDWIRRLRKERILTAWAAEADVPPEVTSADETLSRWWARVNARTGQVPGEQKTAAEAELEWLLLSAALDARARDQMVAAGRDDAAVRPLPAWAVALTELDDAHAVPDAAVASSVLPGAHHLEQVRLDAEAERADVARRQAKRDEIATIRATRNRRFRQELVRSGLGSLIAMGLLGGLLVVLTRAYRQVPVEQPIGPIIVGCGIAALVATFACALWHLVLPAPRARLGLGLVPLTVMLTMSRLIGPVDGREMPLGALLLVPAVGVAAFYVGNLVNLAIDSRLPAPAADASRRIRWAWWERVGLVVWTVALVIKGAYYYSDALEVRRSWGLPGIVDVFVDLPSWYRDNVDSYMFNMADFHEAVLGRSSAPVLATVVAAVPVFLVLGRRTLRLVDPHVLPVAWGLVITAGILSTSYHLVGVSAVVFGLGYVLFIILAVILIVVIMFWLLMVFLDGL